MPTFSLRRTYSLDGKHHVNLADFTLTAEQYTMLVTDNDLPFHEETRDISALAETMQCLFDIDYRIVEK